VCGALDGGRDRDRDQRDTGHHGRVDPPPPSRALPRLLDQRLDKRLQLLAAGRIALIDGTGWGGNAHTTSLARLR
jgi:hypothetical protein